MRRLLPCVLVVFAAACATPSEPEPEPSEPSQAEPSVVAEAEPSADPSQATDPSLCQPGDDWAACVGKRVQIDGKAPEFVQQHPMMTGPFDDGWKQDYMDVSEAMQIIVITKEPGKCKGAMRVVGMLEGIDLGGEPGTKQSYGGWVVREAEVTCM